MVRIDTLFRKQERGDVLRLEEERDYRLLTAGTTLLLVTAILGPLLSVTTIDPFNAIDPFNVYVFRMYLPIYAVALGWYLWTGGGLRTIRQFTLPLPVWSLLGLGAYATVSALFFTDVNRMLYELFMLLTGLFVGVTIVITTTDRRTLSYYLAAVFALVALGEVIALWEIFTDSHLRVSRLLVVEIKPENARLGYDVASAWFANQNTFSFFLSLAAGPLFAHGLTDRRDPRSITRYLAFGGVGLAAVITWANGSRSALLSLILSVVVISIVYAVRPRLGPRGASPRGKRAVVGAVFLAAIVSIVVLLAVPNPFSRADQISLWKRWELGVIGARLVVDSRGLGVGVGDIRHAADAVPPLFFESFVLHNWLLYIASSYGVVGVGLFLYAYGTVLYALGVRAIDASGPLALGFLGTLLAFPLNALGPSNAVLAHSFWIFLFLAIAVVYRVDPQIGLGDPDPRGR